MNVSVKTGSEPVSKQSLRVWLRLLKANATIETALRRKLRDEYDTTLPRFDVMSALARHPEGLKMSDVSKLLRVSNGNVTAIVDRLVDDGLVQRCPTPGDRRAIIISLTNEGANRFGEQASAHETWVADLLSGLGQENLDVFGTMLEDLNTHLETPGDEKRAD